MAADYYEVLGVARDADDGAIKRAYRQLARKYHPDVATDKGAAESHFKEINEAYEVLSDTQKRANYDRFGHAGVNGANDGGFGPFGGEGGFGDIFDMFFGASRGGGTQQRRNGPARGSDLRYDVEISLEEAYAGTTREISFRHLAGCPTCRGSGAEPGTLVVPCDLAGGASGRREDLEKNRLVLDSGALSVVAGEKGRLCLAIREALAQSTGHVGHDARVNRVL